MEPRFRPFFQMHRHHRLRHPVRDRRHTERPDPAAVRLGDLHRPHRRGHVAPRAHPVPDLVEVVLQIGLELAQRLLVHPRSPFVACHPPVRLPHRLLGDIERLVLRRWSVHSSPPGSPRLLSLTSLMSRSLGSTPTPASRCFIATTDRSACAVRNGTRCLGCCLGTLPLSRHSPRERRKVSHLAFSRSCRRP